MTGEDEEKERNCNGLDECELQNWNPMNDAFKNINFNSYAAGPGAQLSTDLQVSLPRNRESHDHEKKLPYLCVKKASKMFTAKGIYNLFSNYAKVSNVRFIPTCEYYFVDFKFLP